MDHTALQIEQLSPGAISATDHAALDGVLFESAHRKDFASAAERAAFRTQWLGLYVDDFPDFVIVARHDSRIVGYIVGCPLTRPDDPRFEALSYFHALGDVLNRAPAHLHINITEPFRASGLGARLIEALIARLAENGVPGVHAITAHDARNARFYERCGFAPTACVPWTDRRLVVMARAIAT
ncbi:MAG: GNAT family N-acetyltransferase [Pseudomonadota bacterium]